MFSPSVYAGGMEHSMAEPEASAERVHGSLVEVGGVGILLLGKSGIHELVRHYLELRGIGIVHVPSLFGEASVAESARIDLVIQLVGWGEAEVERVGLERGTRHIAGFEISALTLPVAPGRNIAALVEVAGRDHALRRSGRSGAAELDARVRELLRRGGS